MKTRNIKTMLIILALSCTPVAAQIQIDKSRPASPAGKIGIENLFGSVEVIGWDQNEVAVTGRLAVGAEGLDFDGDEQGVYIEAEVPDVWLYETDDDTDYRSELTIRVPRGSSVYIETLNATVIVRDISGAVEVETVNGDVQLDGSFPTVEVESMTGSVEVRAEDAEMEIESISGTVSLHGVRGDVAVSTVSGAITIEGTELREIEIETTSGDVIFNGSFAREGGFDLESHSGNVELILQAGVQAQFECTTFSGQITSDLGGRPRRESRFDPHTELRFSTSLDTEFEVCIETFSGNIQLRTGAGTR